MSSIPALIGASATEASPSGSGAPPRTGTAAVPFGVLLAAESARPTATPGAEGAPAFPATHDEATQAEAAWVIPASPDTVPEDGASKAAVSEEAASNAASEEDAASEQAIDARTAAHVSPALPASAQPAAQPTEARGPLAPPAASEEAAAPQPRVRRTATAPIATGDQAHPLRPTESATASADIAPVDAVLVDAAPPPHSPGAVDVPARAADAPTAAAQEPVLPLAAAPPPAAAPADATLDAPITTPDAGDYAPDAEPSAPAKVVSTNEAQVDPAPMDDAVAQTAPPPSPEQPSRPGDAPRAETAPAADADGLAAPRTDLRAETAARTKPDQGRAPASTAQAPEPAIDPFAAPGHATATSAASAPSSSVDTVPVGIGPATDVPADAAQGEATTSRTRPTEPTGTNGSPARAAVEDAPVASAATKAAPAEAPLQARLAGVAARDAAPVPDERTQPSALGPLLFGDVRLRAFSQGARNPAPGAALAADGVEAALPTLPLLRQIRFKETPAAASAGTGTDLASPAPQPSAGTPSAAATAPFFDGTQISQTAVSDALAPAEAAPAPSGLPSEDAAAPPPADDAPLGAEGKLFAETEESVRITERPAARTPGNGKPTALPVSENVAPVEAGPAEAERAEVPTASAASEPEAATPNIVPAASPTAAELADVLPLPDVQPVDAVPDISPELLHELDGEAGTTLARAEAATTAEAPSRPVRTATWLRTLMERHAPTVTSDGVWQQLEVELEDGGTLVVRARREDDHIAVTARFSDPNLRTFAHTNVERLQAALQEHYDTNVDFSLGGEAGEADGGRGEARSKSSGGSRSPNGSTTASPAPAPNAARSHRPGTRHEWVG